MSENPKHCPQCHCQHCPAYGNEKQVVFGNYRLKTYRKCRHCGHRFINFTVYGGDVREHKTQNGGESSQN